MKATVTQFTGLSLPLSPDPAQSILHHGDEHMTRYLFSPQPAPVSSVRAAPLCSRSLVRLRCLAGCLQDSESTSNICGMNKWKRQGWYPIVSLDVGIHSSEFYHRALSPHTIVTDIRQLDALGLKPDKLESSHSNFYQDKQLVFSQPQSSEVLRGRSLPTTPQLRPGSYVLETFSIGNCQTVLSSTALAYA